MLKKNLHKLILASSCLLLFAGQALAGPVSLQAAIAEYKAGKYQSALTMFKTVNQTSPNNAMVHYYMALCHHGLGHTEQAKQEYQAVIASGDPRLKALAQAGMGKVSGVRSSGSSLPAKASGSSETGNSSQTTSATKVKKIIEFYADW